MGSVKAKVKAKNGIKSLDKGKVLQEKTKKPDFKEVPKKIGEKSNHAGSDSDNNADSKADEPRERVPHAPIGSMPEKGKEDDSSVVAYADSKLKDAEEKIYRTGKTTVKQVVGPKRIPYKKAPDPKVKGPTKPTVKNPNIKTKTKPNPKVKKPTTKTPVKPIKQSQKAVGRTADQAAKQSVKAVQKAKKRAEQAKKVAKATRETAKRTAQAAKTTVQAIVAALKSLITAIISGGWVAILIIVVRVRRKSPHRVQRKSPISAQ